MSRARAIRPAVLLFVLAVLIMGSSLGPAPAAAEPPTPTLPNIAPGVAGNIAEDVPFLPSPAEATQGPPGQPLSPPYYNITLNVPAYSQNDPAWRDHVMQTCGKTIGQAGCLLTASTMVFRFYGSSKNPDQVNTCMGNSACDWVWATGANNCSENHATHYGQLSPTDANLVWALTHNYPPILGMRKAAVKATGL